MTVTGLPPRRARAGRTGPPRSLGWWGETPARRAILAFAVTLLVSGLSACTLALGATTFLGRGYGAGAGGEERLPEVAGGRAFAPVSGAQLAAAPPLHDVRMDEGIPVDLPDGRTMYIFADTLHMHVDPKFFVTSSVAITSPDEPLRLRYAVTEKGAPVEFLPRTPKERENEWEGRRYKAVWPTGALMMPDGRIIITYARYSLLLNPLRMTFTGAGLYEFRYPGANAFIRAAPAKRIADDMWTGRDGPVSSPVLHDGYVYFTSCEEMHCYSLRTKPEDITRKETYTWRTWNGWSRNRADRARMQLGGSAPGNGPSVVRLDGLGVFAMSDTPAGAPSSSGRLWISTTPYGPWSKPIEFDLPRCPESGCYGLNIQPGHSTRKSIRVSYSPTGIGPFVYLTDVSVTVSDDKHSIRITE